MTNTALVLEGGALRVVYTAGILDVFMEENIHFPYVIGTSSGSLAGLNYVTNQKGRVAHINISYCKDKHYISMRNRLTYGGVFNFDYLFEEPTPRWPNLDMDTYNHTDKRYIAVATSCETGKPVYFENPKGKAFRPCLEASCSMPLLSKKVATPKGLCLDGGVSASIPYQKPLNEGVEKIVVVKTRERAYRKKEHSGIVNGLYRLAYGKNPEFLQTAMQRPLSYNRQVDDLYALEKQGRVFVIEPQQPVDVGRMERDEDKLKRLYSLAQQQAYALLPAMKAYLASETKIGAQV